MINCVFHESLQCSFSVISLFVSEPWHLLNFTSSSYYSHYTHFHQRTMSPPIMKVTVNFAAALANYRELVILYRISRLTKVILDKRVFSQGDVPHYMLIAAPDMTEVTLARRTLYE